MATATATREPDLPVYFDPASLRDSNRLNTLMYLAVCAFALWHIATNLYITESDRWQNCIHYAGFALLATLTTGPTKPGLAQWLNRAFAVALALASLWVASAESSIYAATLAKTGQSWQLSFIDWVAVLLVIVGAMELSRRLTGWIIPALIAIALAYILFLGQWLPGAFRSASLPIDDVLFRSLYNDEGMFGIITSISSSNITLFMVFGAFLVVSGAADFVIEMSKTVASRFRGGAAFVSVISSALTGTISGSAIANTASTGVITIPLMKANGFRPQFAAGVEASASTGGQLMPPIMGAG
ncbi:MAG: TRAP transporter large permease subunit, partial [Pseudomonadota bacterium]